MASLKKQYEGWECASCHTFCSLSKGEEDDSTKCDMWTPYPKQYTYFKSNGKLKISHDVSIFYAYYQVLVCHVNPCEMYNKIIECTTAHFHIFLSETCIR